MDINKTSEFKQNNDTVTDLFSVILLHYNQQEFLKESLDSIFSQDYRNIELIFADDGTYNLDVQKIKSYIEKNRTPAISNVIYQINDKNVGTVRNINQALKAASGKYALFFAADDALYDSHVLTNFAKELAVLPQDQYMVCGQCAMMDEALKKKKGDFVNRSLAFNMNLITPLEQYKRIVFSCFYAMGASAFRMDMLKEKGFFDETYKIIEDWSYYLSLTYNGSKIIYSDFNALKHRDGGVSHFNKEVLPPHVIEYKNDSLRIQENLVLPHLSKFPLADQVKLLERYENERTNFASLFIDKERPKRISIMLRHKKLYLRKIIWWFMDRVFYLRDRCLHWAKFLFPTWATLSLLKIIASSFAEDKQFLFVNTPAYDIINSIIFILLAVDLLACTAVILLYVVIFLRRNYKNLFSGKR